MLRRLSSVPKNYDWGTPDALSLLRGDPPTGQPEAEAWFGPHPLAQCTITDGGEVPFDQWLSRTGHEFPLLLKFLAASQPLSIQVHPDALAARAGFDREEAAGLALGDPTRTFKDPYPKPELLVCLSESFDIMWGIKTPQALHDTLTRWVNDGFATDSATELHRLADLPLEEAFVAMMSPQGALLDVVADLGRWGTEFVGTGKPRATELERHVFYKIATTFPGDPGILIATVMHITRLGRGEAIFVSPGEIHAYVEGFGLEVMLPSDNVVRAGLTPKHRDTALFLSVATLLASKSQPLVGFTAEGTLATTGSMSLPFSVTRLVGGSLLDTRQDSLVVIEKGPLSAHVLSGPQTLDAGYGYFVPAGEECRALVGDGVAWHVMPRQHDS